MRTLRQRANYEVHTVFEKPLVLYEDHRSLVFVLWHALHAATPKLAKAPLLMYFDDHDDAKQLLPAAAARLQTFRDKLPTEREVFDFVEWDLSGMDDDWLIAAMELGLVGDAICIGALNTSNLTGFTTTHTDQVGGVHRIWQLPHLWDALRDRGELEDLARKNEFCALWEALDWDPGSRKFMDSKDLPDIVLDFDLDCFTLKYWEDLFAWPPALFRKFTRPITASSHPTRCCAADFLGALEPRIAFRTIARESPHCGGTSESQKILARLDRTLWNGELLEG